MSKVLNEEVVALYVNDYLDLLEDLPNRLSPLISQLWELDSRMRHHMNKIELKKNMMIKTTDEEKKKKYLNKIESHVNKITDISKEKLEISAKINDLIASRGDKLTEDREGLILSDQNQPLTYGTRSGNVWNH